MGPGLATFNVGPSTPASAYGGFLTYTDATLTGTGTYYYRISSYSNNGASAWATAAPFAILPLSITTTTLPNGERTALYNQTLVWTGGVGPYTWTKTTGNLPAGLNLSAAGVISGTPTATGTANFTVQLADSIGTTPVTRNLSITIIAGPPTVTTVNPLAAGKVGTAYNQPLAATGGLGPYTWTKATGALPGGLSIVGSAITGTPTATGTFTFTVRVTDSLGGTSVSGTLSIVVTAPNLPSAPTGVTVTPSVISNAPPTVTVAWSYVSNTQSGFQVQRATNASFTTGLQTFNVNNAAALSYLDTTVATTTAYYYRVSAVNVTGNSAWVTATPAPVTTAGILPATLADPTNLHLVSIVNTSTVRADITIAWTDNATNETAYLIERATVTAGVPGAFTQIANLAANSTQTTQVNVTRGTAATPRIYAYRVRASRISGGVTTYSNYTPNLLVTVP